MKSIHKPLIYAALAGNFIFGGCAANKPALNMDTQAETIAAQDSINIREDSLKIKEEKYLQEKLKQPLTIERRAIIDKGLVDVFCLKYALFDNKDEEFESVTFLKSDKSCYGIYKLSNGATVKELPRELNPEYVCNAISCFENKKTMLHVGGNGNTLGGAGVEAGVNHEFSDSVEGFVDVNVGNRERGLVVGSSQQKGDVVFKEQAYVKNFEDEIFGGVGAEVSKYIGTGRGNGIVVGGGLEKTIGRDNTYLKIKIDRVMNEFGRKKSLNSNADCYTQSSDEIPFSLEAKVDPFNKQARADASFTPFFDIPIINMIGIKGHLYYDQETGSKANFSIGIYLNKIPGLDKLLKKVPFNVYIGVMPVKQGDKWAYQLDIGL